MFYGFAFVAFGLLGGLAYLAWRREEELVSYGIGLLAIAAFLGGMMGLAEGASSLVTTLELLRNVAFGAGVAFLLYVGTIYGVDYQRRRRERQKTAADPMRIEARKDAEPRAKPFQITR